MDEQQAAPSSGRIILVIVIILVIIAIIILIVAAWNSGNTTTSTSNANAAEKEQDKPASDDEEDDNDEDGEDFDPPAAGKMQVRFDSKPAPVSSAPAMLDYNSSGIDVYSDSDSESDRSSRDTSGADITNSNSKHQSSDASEILATVEDVKLSAKSPRRPRTPQPSSEIPSRPDSNDDVMDSLHESDIGTMPSDSLPSSPKVSSLETSSSKSPGPSLKIIRPAAPKPIIVSPYKPPVVNLKTPASSSLGVETSGLSVNASISDPASMSSDFSSQTEKSKRHK
jgi:FtsZ-interacting cell division protein ZipA